MPSLSKSQQRLMGWAYSCKKGGDCPDKVKKIAKGMKLSTLKKFAKTKHKGLPLKVQENLIYSTKGVNASITEEELKLFLSWLDSKKIAYVLDEKSQQITILQKELIPKEEQKMFSDYVNRLNLKKVWENNLAVTNNLSLISGQGNVQPPTKDGVGSGDVWNNGIFKRKKRKKIKKLKEFINEGLGDFMLTGLEAAGRQAKVQHNNWVAGEAAADAIERRRRNAKPRPKVQSSEISIAKIKKTSNVMVFVPNTKTNWSVVCNVTPQVADGINFVFQGGNDVSQEFKSKWNKLDKDEKKLWASEGAKIQDKLQKDIRNFIEREIEQQTAKIEKGIEMLIKQSQKDLSQIINL